MLSPEDYNILRLYRSKNVGSQTFIKLMNFFGSPKNAIENIGEFNRKSRLKSPVVIASREEIDREIVGCSTVGAKIITYRNSFYPTLLKEIDSFPPILTTLGDLKLFGRKSISIVGSRTASSNGCNFARKLAGELGDAGYVVTSGFASGIDTAAHRGSIGTGTIAVLGGGVDDIYPKGNEELYYEIKNRGLILSEVPLNSMPRAENFPARNRIVSGLSEAIIVIEAGARSGTLHTARQALEQGRELLIAPGNPYDYRCEGSNKLIKDGAAVVTNTEDVLEILQNINISNRFVLKDSKPKIKNNHRVEKNIKLEDESVEVSAPSNTKELILSKLNHTPISIDLLSQDLGLSASAINAELTELELEGSVVIGGGAVRLRE